MATVAQVGNLRPGFAYRAIKIVWQPRSGTQWSIFNAARSEAARLWNELVERHSLIRQNGEKWPSKEAWQKWAKQNYPNLHSQLVQHIIEEFVEAVNSARQLRANGVSPEQAKYPYRKSQFRDVVYTNQGARIRDGYLFLPNGKAGTLRIKVPDTVRLPGRLIEVRLGFHNVILICGIPDEVKPSGSAIGVDLGVNTLLAATDGEKAVLVSGRAIKADVQYRNKQLAGLQQKQSKMIKGSRRWKRLQSRKTKMMAKAQRRINDKMHKATRIIAQEFPNANAYVGKPFNDAARKLGRRQAQQVSSACNAKLIRMLDYKLAGVREAEEGLSSQTCPVCGHRNRCQRIYACGGCGFTAPRDVVGSVGILCIGWHGRLLPNQGIPKIVKFKYPEHCSGSSLGRSAGSSA